MAHDQGVAGQLAAEQVRRFAGPNAIDGRLQFGRECGDRIAVAEAGCSDLAAGGEHRQRLYARLVDQRRLLEIDLEAVDERPAVLAKAPLAQATVGPPGP